MPAFDKFSGVVKDHGFMLDKASGATSTVATAAAKDQAVVVVAAISTFANGQDVFVGTELCRISSGGGTTSLTMTKNLKYDHPVGDVVVEQAAYSFGTAEADGLKFRIANETTDVFGVLSRFFYNKLPGFISFTGSMRMPTPTIDVLAMAHGIRRSEVLGDGTAVQQTGTAGPRVVFSDGSNCGTLTRACFYATVQLVDGTWRTFYAYNLSFNPTTISVQFARGVVANVPIDFMMTGYAIDFTNSQFVPSTVVQTYNAAKTDMIGELVSIDNYALGTPTTLTAQVAAGAYQFLVTSATGLAAGGIVKLGTGDFAEFHEIHAIATLTVQLKTQVQRTWANASAVTPLTPTSFAGVSRGGATYAMSGSADERVVETERAKQGYNLGNLAPKWTFNLSSLQPENFYLSTGTPVADYASSVLTFRNAAKSTGLECVVMRFLTLGGRSIKCVNWLPVVEVQSEQVLSQAVETQLPVTLLPAATYWIGTP